MGTAQRARTHVDAGVDPRRRTGRRALLAGWIDVAWNQAHSPTTFGAPL